jgi:hypothetical protein
MKLLTAPLQIGGWWGEPSLATSLELCVGAALLMSVCYVDFCTKMCVKNRWWTSGSYLGICPNSRWRQVKQWWFIPLVDLCALYLIHIHVKCVHPRIPFWELLLEVIHVLLFTYVEGVFRACYMCWLLFWRRGSICLTHVRWGGLMLVSCIVHPSFFAWKFRRNHMVRPYRYNKHHALLEEGYDAASYP